MSHKILITGAGGFVGTHLIQALKEKGEYEIFAGAYKATSDISDLLSEDHIIAGDLTDFEYASTLVQQSQPDLVFHLAALSIVHSSDTQAVSVMNGNTAISYNLLEALRQRAPSARFIAISSGNVYGAVLDGSVPIAEKTQLRPLNPYAVSKVSQEMLALEFHLAHGMDVVILRPFNHTGVGQTTNFVIPRFAKKFVEIEQGSLPPVLEVGNIDSIRDFTDVSDMVEAYLLAAEQGVSGEIYNLGSGSGHSIKEILDIFQSLTKVQVDIKVSDRLVRSSDVPVLVADATKFKSLTGWEPKVSLESTISAILENYRQK